MTDTSTTRAAPPAARPDTVALTAYVDHPFESVCAVFEQWGGTPQRGYTIGTMTKPSTFVARVPVSSGSPEQEAELRALPVWTGCDAVTELLLVVRARHNNHHERLVEDGRTMLDALTGAIDGALQSG